MFIFPWAPSPLSGAQSGLSPAVALPGRGKTAFLAGHMAKLLTIAALAVMAVSFFSRFYPDGETARETAAQNVIIDVQGASPGEGQGAEPDGQFTPPPTDADSRAEDAPTDPGGGTEQAFLPIVGLPEGYVALTFDDGPSPYTRQIVDILAEHKVGATFFFVGSQVENYPEQVEYAYKRGFVIGNHTWSHQELPSLLPAEQKEEILRTHLLLENLIGHPSPLVRPPYGMFDDVTTGLLRELGFSLVTWNRDPQDWRVTSPDELVRYFKQTDPSGGVVLLHEKKNTVDALPAIIRYLQDSGLKIVALPHPESDLK